jgi:prophage regulatory protein
MAPYVIGREQSNMHHLPEAGYVRLSQIVGDPKADPPVPPVIPVCKSTWWAGVKSGKYPKPIKLSPHVTAW